MYIPCVGKQSSRVITFVVFFILAVQNVFAKPAIVVVASKIGARLDSDLSNGGGTEDTAILQGILDRASNSQAVDLIIDGPALVSGLDVYGNTTVECTAGGGLYLQDGASRAVIRNKHRTRADVIDSNIELRRCVINGNRNHQKGRGGISGYNDNLTSQEADGTYMSGLQFLGVHNLRIDGVVVLNTLSFGIWVSNANEVEMHDIRIDDMSPSLDGLDTAARRGLWYKYTQTDGIHFNGPVHHARLSDLVLRTGDDALAFNANDMGRDDFTGTNDMGPYVGQGPITDVVVDNVLLRGAEEGIRLLSSTERIDRVIVSNVVGTVRYRLVILSHFLTKNSYGNFGTVTFRDVSVDPIKYDGVLDELRRQTKGLYGDELDYPLFSLNGHIETLNIRGVVAKLDDTRPLIRVGRDTRVNSLSVELKADDPKLQSVPLMLCKGGVVDRLEFSLEWAGLDGRQGVKPIADFGGKVEKLNWTGDWQPR